MATQIGGTATLPTVPVVQPTSPDTTFETATPALPTVEVVLPPAGNAAWNAIKQDYSSFEAPRTYALPGSTLLWWYDTATAQFVPLGWASTSVEAIGQFRVRWQGIEALVVPFTLNASYGLTLDSSMIERIRRAGYTEATIETFIYLAPDIVPLAQ